MYVQGGPSAGAIHTPQSCRQGRTPLAPPAFRILCTLQDRVQHDSKGGGFHLSASACFPARTNTIPTFLTRKEIYQFRLSIGISIPAVFVYPEVLTIRSRYGALLRNGACRFAQTIMHTRPLRALPRPVGRPMISPGDVWHVKHPDQVRRALGPTKADRSWKTAL